MNNKEVAFGFELQEPKVLLTTVLYSVYAAFTPLTEDKTFKMLRLSLSETILRRRIDVKRRQKIGTMIIIFQNFNAKLPKTILM